MAHASRMEKANLLVKKMRNQKAKQKLENSKLSEEEKSEKMEKRNEKSYKDIIQTMKWDLSQGQLSRSKYNSFIELINKRINEIIENKENKEEIYELKKLKIKLGGNE